MQGTHWLLDAIKEMEEYAEEHQLTGMMEGLGTVLEIYAAEASVHESEYQEVISKLKKQSGRTC